MRLVSAVAAYIKAVIVISIVVDDDDVDDVRDTSLRRPVAMVTRQTCQLEVATM